MGSIASAISHSLGSNRHGFLPNLISKRDYEALPQLPTLRHPRSLLAVGGNNKEIPLLLWSTVRVRISTRSTSNDFGVVKNLPLDLLLGVEFPPRHECQLI